MASYKVIQDVEAEEKLLGPLTLHQFIYAAVAATCLFLTYVVVARGVAFLAIIFFPPAIVSGFLAFPWGRDQPTEIWALAKIRFYLKPRKRIWNQSGQKEVVTITAPKREIIDYTGGLSRGEVKSRLKSLAEMIDSHGWAIKGAPAPYISPVPVQTTSGSDRLVSANFSNQVGPQDNIQASEDMLDEKNNPNAKRLTSMVEASSQARRQKIIEELNQTVPTPPVPARPTPVQQQAATTPKPRPKPAAAPKQPSNYWFLDQPSATAVPSDKVTFNTQVVTPGAAQDDKQTKTAADNPVEEEILHELQEHEKQSADSGYYSHLPKVLPLEEQRKMAAERQRQELAQRALEAQKVASHPQPTPTQQALSRNDDLNIATLARQAEDTNRDGSVTISLR
jgi:hypothetical protein